MLAPLKQGETQLTDKLQALLTTLYFFGNCVIILQEKECHNASLNQSLIKFLETTNYL